LVTVGRVRRLALSLPDTEEHRQRGRASFAVRGRTFVALTTRAERAVLKLSHDEQDVLTRSHPGVFAAARRRERGFTLVELRLVDAWVFEELLVAAWRRVVPRRSAARWDAERRLPGGGHGDPLGSRRRRGRGARSVSGRGRARRDAGTAARARSG
jgi:hypothetical protein